MAAAQGATLRELMERMGHSSTRAALIYIAGGWHEVPHIGDATGTPQGTRLLTVRNNQRINRGGELTYRARCLEVTVTDSSLGS